MKSVFFLLWICLVLAGGCHNQPTDTLVVEQSMEIYPFKSAILQYSFDDRGTEGTRTVYIDNWGELWAEYESRELRNDDLAEKVTIRRGTEVYTIYLEDKVAVKSIESQPKPEGVDLKSLAVIHGSREKALDRLSEKGIRLIGKESVKGYTCQVIERKQGPLVSKRWIYKGVSLRVVEYLGKNLNFVSEENFVEVQFDVPVDPRHFKLPEGIVLSQN